MSKKTAWLNTRSIPKGRNKIIEVLGSDDASCDKLRVFTVTFDKDIGCFVTSSGWVVTPFAWREVPSASKSTLGK